MLGGQHRDDEGNGPSRSGERKTEGRSNRESNQPSAAAQTCGCAQEKQKLRRNVLDGADFVREVLNIYPNTPLSAAGALAASRAPPPAKLKIGKSTGD
jgi:hypothetical protein